MRSVWWEDNVLKMIDQRKLPAEFEIAIWSDYHGVARAIKGMYVRGAPAIGVAAAFGLVLAARYSPAPTYEEWISDLGRAYEVLVSTRPTAVNLCRGLDRIMDLAHAGVNEDLAVLKDLLLEEAQLLADETVQINRQMGHHGADLVHDADTVLTHCNTGMLAAVGFGTALGVVRAAVEQGKQVRVLADETRPRGQGARLTTWELARDGIPVTLIVDGAAGHFMRRGEVDLVLIGADRIAANGDVANKIGSYSVAVLARENGIPFYVVAPMSTVDLSVPAGDDIPIEERSADEVTHLDGVLVAPEDVRVANPAFDVTPHRYVTGIVTERGIAYPPFDLSLRRMAEQERQEEDGSA